MKTVNFFLFIISILFIASCTNPKETNEYIELQGKYDSVSTENNYKEKSLNDFFDAFVNIEANLEEIKEAEELITVELQSGPENAASLEQNILEDIDLIYRKMQDNKKRLAKLEQKFDNAHGQIANLKKLIVDLKQKIEAKNIEIASLNTRLTEMNIEMKGLNLKIDTLLAESYEQEIKIDSLTDKLNTGYFAIGTEKELVENKVIKKGEMFGLRKSKNLAKNFNKEYFTNIDIRKKTEFILGGEKARLLTNHPDDSFEWEMDGKTFKKLIVTDIDKFWDTSDFLVIVMK